MFKQRIFYCACIIGFLIQSVQSFDYGSGVCRRFLRRVCCKGYIRDLTARGFKCTPYCNSCMNGQCTAPNVCECNLGYQEIDGVCSPVCSVPCNNGVCVSPENCLCSPGYRMSYLNVCEPVCTVECHNGFCSAPDLCSCHVGFRMVNGTTCEPICSPSCFNGQCVAPNKCECYPGFEPWHGPVGREGLEKYTCMPFSTTSTSTALPTSVSTTVYKTTEVVTVKDTESDQPSDSELETTSKDITRATREMTINITSATVATIINTSNTDTDQTVEDSSVAYSTDTIAIKQNQYYWIYLTVGSVLLAALLIVVVVLRRKIICYKGGSYVVGDQPPKRTQNSFNVQYSSTMKTQ